MLSFGSSAASLLTATLLALVTTFFFLADGNRIWRWVVGLLPSDHRRRTDRAATRAWDALQAYIRTQTLVAAVDAIGIGLGAYFLGLPYVEAIVLIVFITAFVPIVGAVFSGGLAVLIALGSQGVAEALIMLAVVLVVQQVESNVLQPVLMGKAVDLHPWAVIVGVPRFLPARHHRRGPGRAGHGHRQHRRPVVAGTVDRGRVETDPVPDGEPTDDLVL